MHAVESDTVMRGLLSFEGCDVMVKRFVLRSALFSAGLADSWYGRQEGELMAKLLRKVITAGTLKPAPACAQYNLQSSGSRVAGGSASPTDVRSRLTFVSSTAASETRPWPGLRGTSSNAAETREFHLG
jgi:hypothetical protein